jgi:Transposase
MRFRGLLRGGTVGKLDAWLGDARQCGIFGMRRFAQTLRQDIGAVRNAMLEQFSNGQAEGQINRLKTLKRSMYATDSVVHGSEVSAPWAQSLSGSDDADIVRASQLQHTVEEINRHIDFRHPTFVYT